jgi:malate synthase
MSRRLRAMRWTGPWLTEASGDVDVQYVWRFLRELNIDLAARKSWRESNDPEFVAKAADWSAFTSKALCASTRSLRSRHCSRTKLFDSAEKTRLTGRSP